MGCDLMPTIKRKVEMNLPQLIEWAWDNKIRSKTYRSLGGAEIEFSEGDVVRVYRTDSDDTFAVEFEEVVDSNTVLDNVYTVNVEEGTSHTTYYKSKSINEVKTDEINIIYTIFQEEAIVLWDSQGGFR